MTPAWQALCGSADLDYVHLPVVNRIVLQGDENTILPLAPEESVVYFSDR